MIQRIQTLYLAIIVGLGITLCFMPIVRFSSNENSLEQRMFVMDMQGLQELDENMENIKPQDMEMKGMWGLMLTTILIPLLALIDIFLYRNRILQARLNIFLALLCLGYYAVMGVYIWLADINWGLEWDIEFAACFPLVCFILTLMATRAILKDETLVRAADRLR